MLKPHMNRFHKGLCGVNIQIMLNKLAVAWVRLLIIKQINTDTQTAQKLVEF